MKKLSLLIAITSIVLLSACENAENSPRGFSLPKGDPELGKQVFIRHNCLACHSVVDIPDNGIEREHTPPIVIGSNSAIVTTYAELVTSVINPSHQISRGAKWATSQQSGDSVMPVYNDVLTVTELINVVSYLQTHYKVTPLPYTVYPSFYDPVK